VIDHVEAGIPLGPVHGGDIHEELETLIEQRLRHLGDALRRHQEGVIPPEGVVFEDGAGQAFFDALKDHGSSYQIRWAPVWPASSTMLRTAWWAVSPCSASRSRWRSMLS